MSGDRTLMEGEKSIIKEAIKTYPVLIQFNEICCGEHVEDEKVCDEMEKKYSPPPGVDTKCDCFVENLKVDAIGDKMADKGFPNVEITFRLPSVRGFEIDTRSFESYTWLLPTIEVEKPLIIEIIRQYRIYKYVYAIYAHPPPEIPEPVIIERPHYEVKGWVEQKKGARVYSTPEIIDIEKPDKGRLSYVVLVPDYDVIIDVEPNGDTGVVIWDSSNYGPVCIEPLVRDLRRKIID
ncbi:MAG: hypothetical protein RQ842_09635 [Vulcanisaeta sp.]|nr:hypothetical protein [Vulcanisaeta sp.]